LGVIFPFLLAQLLFGDEAPKVAPTPTVQESQLQLAKCVTQKRPTAVLVMIRGFNWSSGSIEAWRKDKGMEYRPDIWTINDDCSVKEHDRFFYVDPNPFAGVGSDISAAVRAVKDLYKEPANHGRPLILIGHSMGAAFLQDAVEQLMKADCRPDLVVALDAVSVREQFAEAVVSTQVRRLVEEYFGVSLKVDLGDAFPYAVAHIRAAPTDRLDSANFLRRATLVGGHQHVEYTLKGVGHTTIDSSAIALQLIEHLISLVPEEGLNRGIPATPADYKPAKLPTKVEELPRTLDRAAVRITSP